MKEFRIYFRSGKTIDISETIYDTLVERMKAKGGIYNFQSFVYNQDGTIRKFSFNLMHIESIEEIYAKN